MLTTHIVPVGNHNQHIALVIEIDSNDDVKAYVGDVCVAVAWRSLGVAGSWNAFDIRSGGPSYGAAYSRSEAQRMVRDRALRYVGQDLSA